MRSADCIINIRKSLAFLALSAALSMHSLCTLYEWIFFIVFGTFNFFIHMRLLLEMLSFAITETAKISLLHQKLILSLDSLFISCLIAQKLYFFALESNQNTLGIFSSLAGLAGLAVLYLILFLLYFLYNPRNTAYWVS